MQLYHLCSFRDQSQTSRVLLVESAFRSQNVDPKHCQAETKQNKFS